MKRLRVRGRVALIMGAAAIAAAAHDDSGVVRLDGHITPGLVERVISELDDKAGKRVTLLVTSQGGDVTSALRLGEQIRERGVDVIVDGLCMSSCANYVFPAGKTKRILPGALVVWHGSVLQKDFRERVQRYDTLTQQASTQPLDGAAAQELYALEANVAFLKSAQLAQERFFLRLGIDERLTRLGQEPTPIAENWTVSVETMRRFGLQGVEAPSDYGTASYQSPWQSLLRVSCLSAVIRQGSVQARLC